MMKYAVPEIKPYHFITEIETTASTVITQNYAHDATLIENVNEAEAHIHTRFESIKDIISFSSGE